MAGDFVIALYSIIYLAIIGGFTYTFIVALGKVVRLEFDLKDLSISMGIYFMLIGFAYLQTTYLIDATIGGILEVLIDVGVWTNCVLPAIFFIITLTMGSYMERRVKGVDY